MTDNQKTIFLKKVLSGDEILHMKMKYDPFFSFFIRCHLFFILILLLKIICDDTKTSPVDLVLSS